MRSSNWNLRLQWRMPLPFVCVLLTAAPEAMAQTTSTVQTEAQTHIAAPSSADRVTSQVLFERAKSLLLEGRFAESCPLFEESQRLAPGVGVLLHLGMCLEKLGKTASAWAAFQEAAERAEADGDKARTQLAKERALSLLPRRAYVTLRVQAQSVDGSPSTAILGDLRAQRDQELLPASLLGVEVPVDPGQHDFAVSASGFSEARRRVTLREGERTMVALELVSLPAEDATASRSPVPRSDAALPRASAPNATLPASPMHREQPATPSTQRNWIVGTALGVGAAGVTLGVVSGLVAYFKMQDARDLCAGHARNDCPAESLRLQERAQFPASVATVSVIAGLSSAALGITNWALTRPRAQAPVVSVGVAANTTMAHVAVRTRW
ncbi:MAG TPA: tetratricopeptide repeat protein, partial [Polyangiaceae bacterium]